MWNKIVLKALGPILDKYVEELDSNQIGISLFGGEVVLDRIRLKRTALDDMKTGFRIHTGYIHHIRAKIPWTNLYSAPINIEVEGIYIILTPDLTDTYNLEETIKAEKDEKERVIQDMEDKIAAYKKPTPQTKKEPQPEAAKNPLPVNDPGFVERMATQIIKNVQVTIKTIHVRFENHLINPEKPFNLGLSLGGISFHLCDGNWERKEETDEGTRIYKLLTLDSLAVYWNPNDPVALSEDDVTIWSSTVDRVIALTATETNQPEGMQWLVEPICGRVELIIESRPEFIDFVMPRVEVRVLLHRVALRIASLQMDSILAYLHTMDSKGRAAQYRRYRPLHPVKRNAPAWWRFAIRCVLLHVQPHSRRWNWKYISLSLSKRRRYEATYLTYLSSMVPSAATVKALKMMEADPRLDPFMIVLARQRARIAKKNGLKLKDLVDQYPELASQHHQSGTKLWFWEKEEEIELWQTLLLEDQRYSIAPRAPGQKGEEKLTFAKKVQSAWTEDEVNKLFAAIGYEVEVGGGGAEESPFAHDPVEYVGIKVAFLLKVFEVNLIGHNLGKEFQVIKFRVEEIAARINLRLKYGIGKCVLLTAQIGGIFLYGENKKATETGGYLNVNRAPGKKAPRRKGSTPSVATVRQGPAVMIGPSPYVTAEQRQWQEEWRQISGAATPLIYATVETMPLSGEASIVVTLRMMSLAVALDFQTVVELLAFTAPTGTYVFTETIKIRTVTKVRPHIQIVKDETMRTLLGRREFVCIKVDLFPVHVFLPEHGIFDDVHHRMLIIQSGHIRIRSSEVTCGKPLADMTIPEMVDDSYDRFIFMLMKLQIVVTLPRDKWREKLDRGNSFTHILSSTELTFDIRNSLFSNDIRLPNLHVIGNLPHLVFSINEPIIEELAKIIVSLPLHKLSEGEQGNVNWQTPFGRPGLLEMTLNQATKIQWTAEDRRLQVEAIQRMTRRMLAENTNADIDADANKNEASNENQNAAFRKTMRVERHLRRETRQSIIRRSRRREELGEGRATVSFATHASVRGTPRSASSWLSSLYATSKLGNSKAGSNLESGYPMESSSNATSPLGNSQVTSRIDSTLASSNPGSKPNRSNADSRMGGAQRDLRPESTNLSKRVSTSRSRPANFNSKRRETHASLDESQGESWSATLSMEKDIPDQDTDSDSEMSRNDISTIASGESYTAILGLNTESTDLSLRMELGRVELRLCHNRKKSLKGTTEENGPLPFIVMGLKNLGARIKIQNYNTKVEAHMGGIYVQCTDHKDPYDEDDSVYLVRGPIVSKKMKFIPGGEPRLFAVHITIADPFGPEFKRSFKQTETNIAVQFSHLLLYVHQEAFLVIFANILEVYLQVERGLMDYIKDLRRASNFSHSHPEFNISAVASRMFGAARDSASSGLRRTRRRFARREEKRRRTNYYSENYWRRRLAGLRRAKIAPTLKNYNNNLSSISADLESYQVFLSAMFVKLQLAIGNEHDGVLTTFDINHINAKVSVQVHHTCVKATINGVMLHNVEGGLYPDILKSIGSRELLHFKMDQYPNAIHVDRRDMDIVDTSIRVYLGRLQLVVLNKFVTNLSAFAEDFKASQETIDAILEAISRSLAQGAEASAKAVIEMQRHAIRTKLDCTLLAPVIFLPQGSKSPNGFKVELGNLRITNKFTFAGAFMSEETWEEMGRGIGKPTGPMRYPIPAVCDEMHVHITRTRIYRVHEIICDDRMKQQRNADIFHPIEIFVEIKRNLSSTWYKGIPETDLKTDLGKFQFDLSQCDLTHLFMTLNDNIKEGVHLGQEIQLRRLGIEVERDEYNESHNESQRLTNRDSFSVRADRRRRSWREETMMEMATEIVVDSIREEAERRKSEEESRKNSTVVTIDADDDDGGGDNTNADEYDQRRRRGKPARDSGASTGAIEQTGTATDESHSTWTAPVMISQLMDGDASRYDRGPPSPASPPSPPRRRVGNRGKKPAPPRPPSGRVERTGHYDEIGSKAKDAGGGGGGAATSVQESKTKQKSMTEISKWMLTGTAADQEECRNDEDIVTIAGTLDDDLDRSSGSADYDGFNVFARRHVSDIFTHEGGGGGKGKKGKKSAEKKFKTKVLVTLRSIDFSLFNSEQVTLMTMTEQREATRKNDRLLMNFCISRIGVKLLADFADHLEILFFIRAINWDDCRESSKVGISRILHRRDKGQPGHHIIQVDMVSRPPKPFDPMAITSVGVSPSMVKLAMEQQIPLPNTKIHIKLDHFHFCVCVEFFVAVGNVFISAMNDAAENLTMLKVLRTVSKKRAEMTKEEQATYEHFQRVKKDILRSQAKQEEKANRELAAKMNAVKAMEEADLNSMPESVPPSLPIGASTNRRGVAPAGRGDENGTDASFGINMSYDDYDSFGVLTNFARGVGNSAGGGVGGASGGEEHGGDGEDRGGGGGDGGVAPPQGRTLYRFRSRFVNVGDYDDDGDDNSDSDSSFSDEDYNYNQNQNNNSGSSDDSDESDDSDDSDDTGDTDEEEKEEEAKNEDEDDDDDDDSSSATSGWSDKPERNFNVNNNNLRTHNIRGRLYSSFNADEGYPVFSRHLARVEEAGGHSTMDLMNRATSALTTHGKSTNSTPEAIDVTSIEIELTQPEIVIIAQPRSRRTGALRFNFDLCLSVLQAASFMEVSLQLVDLSLSFVRYARMMASKDKVHALHHAVLPCNIGCRVRMGEGRMSVDADLDDLVIDISPRILRTLTIATEPLADLKQVVDVEKEQRDRRTGLLKKHEPSIWDVKSNDDEDFWFLRPVGHLEYSWLFAKRHKTLFIYKHRQMAKEEELERLRRPPKKYSLPNTTSLQTLQQWKPQPSEDTLGEAEEIADEETVDEVVPLKKLSVGSSVIEEELKVKLGNIVFKLSTDTASESVPMLIAQLNIKSDMRDWSGLFNISLVIRVQVHYLNARMAVWEPLLEPIRTQRDPWRASKLRPWAINIDIKKNPEREDEEEQEMEEDPDNPRLMEIPAEFTISITTEEDLEIVFSKALLRLLDRLGVEFSKAVNIDEDYVLGLNAPYMIFNRSGVTLALKLTADFCRENPDTGSDTLTDRSLSITQQSVASHHGAIATHRISTGRISYVEGTTSEDTTIPFKTGTFVPLWPSDFKQKNDTTFRLSQELDTGMEDKSKHLVVVVPSFKDIMEIEVLRGETRVFPLNYGRSEYTLVAESTPSYTYMSVMFRSLVQLHNHMSVPMQILIGPATMFQVPRKSDGFIDDSCLTYLTTVDPAKEKDFDVPLEAIHGKDAGALFIRPLLNNQHLHDVSNESLGWRKVFLEMKAQEDAEPVKNFRRAKIIRCAPFDPETYTQICVSVQTSVRQGVLGQRQKSEFRVSTSTPLSVKTPSFKEPTGVSYVYHIHLRPLLVIKNNLPIMMEYHHSITPRSDELDFHELPPGEEVPLYALKDSEEEEGDLMVKVKLPDYLGKDWLGELPVGCKPKEQLLIVTEFYEEDQLSGMNDFFQIGVHVRATDTGEMSAHLFAPYWIVNQTGLPARFKLSKDADPPMSLAFYGRMMKAMTSSWGRCFKNCTKRKSKEEKRIEEKIKKSASRRRRKDSDEIHRSGPDLLHFINREIADIEKYEVAEEKRNAKMKNQRENENRRSHNKSRSKGAITNADTDEQSPVSASERPSKSVKLTLPHEVMKIEEKAKNEEEDESEDDSEDDDDDDDDKKTDDEGTKPGGSDEEEEEEEEVQEEDVRRSSDIPEHLAAKNQRDEMMEHFQRFTEREDKMHADAQRGAIKMNIFEDKGDVIIKAKGQKMERHTFPEYAGINFTSMLQESDNIMYMKGDFPSEPDIFKMKSRGIFSKKKISISIAGSQWSDRLSMDTTGSSLVVSCTDNKNGQKYTLAWTVTMAASALTKILTLTPYYMITNVGSKLISVHDVIPEPTLADATGVAGGWFQWAGNNGDDKEGEEEEDRWLIVQPGAVKAFWPHPKNKTLQMVVRFEDASECETMPFTMAQELHTLLAMPQHSHHGIQIHATLSDAALIMGVQQYQTGMAPVQIVNACNMDVRVYQKGSMRITVKPTQNVLYTWQNSFIERELHWDCGTQGYGRNMLTRDGLGDFHVAPDTKAKYWVSFLNGRQRILMFTDDLYMAVRAKEIGELERNNLEVAVDLKGFGVSLVDTDLRKEVIYLGLADSDVSWERMTGKEKYRALPEQASIVLEKAYQQHLHKMEVEGITGFGIVKAGLMQIDFSVLYMLAPDITRIRRRYQPGIAIRLKLSAHTFSLHCVLHKLQIDNQQDGCIFPTTFAPRMTPMSIRRAPIPPSFVDIRIAVRTFDMSDVKQIKTFRVDIKPMDLKADWVLINGIVNFFNLPDGSSGNKLKADMAEAVKPLIAYAREWSSADSGANFFDDLDISSIVLHLSFSLRGDVFQEPMDTQDFEDPKDEKPQQHSEGLNPQLVSGNLFLKSVGVALTDIQDIEFSLSGFGKQNAFLSQQQLVRECVRHYAVQAMQNMHVLMFGLDFLGNPVGLLKNFFEGFKHVVVEPYRGYGEGETLEGMAMGFKQFFGCIIGGTAHSAGLLTGSFGKAFAALTLDEDYQRRRREEHQNAPNDLTEGFVRGLKACLLGFGEGFSGIVMKPLNAKRNSGNVPQGTAQGIMGFIARPLAGTFDLLTTTLEGVRYQSRMGRELLQLRPRRYIKPSGILHPYLAQESEGYWLLNEADFGRYVKTDDYVFHCRLMNNQGHEGPTLLVTDRRSLLLSRGDIFGFVESEWAIRWSDLEKPPFKNPRGIRFETIVPEEKEARVPPRTILMPDQEMLDHIVAILQRAHKKFISALETEASVKESYRSDESESDSILEIEDEVKVKIADEEEEEEVGEPEDDAFVV